MGVLRYIASLIVRAAFSQAAGADPLAVVGSVFVTQKVLGFNRFVGWPMHHTSRVVKPGNVKLGKRSFPGWSQGCYIQAKNGITIGHNLRMGPNVGLISANHSADDYDVWVGDGPITIGDNVWIGMGAVVLPGVTIGDNVVIAANSVVNRDVPSNCIAGGIPCKVIKDKAPYTGFDYSTL